MLLGYLIGEDTVFQWMNEWVSEWMNEGMDEWVNEWGSKWRSEGMNEWVSEWMNEWVNVCWLWMKLQLTAFPPPGPSHPPTYKPPQGGVHVLLIPPSCTSKHSPDSGMYKVPKNVHWKPDSVTVAPHSWGPCGQDGEQGWSLSSHFKLRSWVRAFLWGLCRLGLSCLSRVTGVRAGSAGSVTLSLILDTYEVRVRELLRLQGLRYSVFWLGSVLLVC